MSAQKSVDAIARRNENRSQGEIAIAKLLDDGMRKQIQNALPSALSGNAQHFLRVAITALRTNRTLMECSPQSIFGAVMQAAQLGLDLDGVLGHAYLVPYKGQAQLQIGYRGYIVLAHRGGAKAVTAEVVRERDHFQFRLGTDGFIDHRPALVDRGEPVAAWCVCSFAGGETFRVLTLDDIEKARESSSAYSRGRKDSPWFTHPEEMMRKTAVRSTLKYAPLSAEITRAAVADEYRDAGITIASASVLDVTPELEAHTPEPEPEVREPGEEG